MEVEFYFKLWRILGNAAVVIGRKSSLGET
jgi:hypothetical protein